MIPWAEFWVVYAQVLIIVGTGLVAVLGLCAAVVYLGRDS